MIRWRIPPENSCGYWLNRVGGMPILPEGLQRPASDLVVLHARLVLLQGLRKVLFDPHERIQPSHWLLEDQPQVRAAETAQLAISHPDEVAPAVQHLAIGYGSFRKQPENAPSERRLAAARLADEPEHLAGADLERDPVDRANGAAQGAVVDAQIAHRDDRCVRQGSSIRVSRWHRDQRP